MKWRAAILLAAELLTLAFGQSAAAQINPTLSEAERGIRTEDDATPAERVRIDELLVRAHVAGRTADITLEMLLSSDTASMFEAQLALALPADAVVTGYALSVGKAMIPGQLLEQPKARNIYEDEVRGGIDPGLAEVTAGNQFTTRIYPIDRDNPRRFRLSFAIPFDPERGFVLPLSRDAAIGKTRFDVTVDGYADAPQVRFAGQAVPLARAGQSWSGTVSGERLKLRDGLQITGGTLAAPLLVTEHSGGDRFFVIADADSKAATVSTPPGRLRIYWDRSLSHGRDDTGLEADALIRLVDATAPTGIDLVTFASDRPQVAKLSGPAELRKALSAIVYRGATSFAGLDGIDLPAANRCVMVSDGQVTIDRAAEFIPDCRLTILTGSAQADGARLGRIAQASSGNLVRVTKGGAARAAEAIAKAGTGIASVRDSAGRRIAIRVLPAAPGHWLLVGPMPDKGGVRLRLSDGSERRYAGDTPVRADAAAALWAAQQVQILGDDPARHQAMVDMARRYHVAGPAMSLLVLERPDQYVRAGIAPPTGFAKDWMADYLERKRDFDEDARDSRSERFDFVLREWQARKSWWNQRFTPQARPKRAKAEVLSMPPPPPVPASAPPPSEMGQPLERVAGVSVESADDLGEVVVTGVQASRLPALTVDAPARSPADRASVAIDLADLLADRSYIAALDAAAPAARLKVLAEQERALGSTPSFYFDVAEWFRSKGDMATAGQLLLSALELPQSDDETRQIVAFRLERDKSFDRAVELSEALAAANSEFRPQPARDLALALAARGRSRGASGRADLERAISLLIDAALNPASSDFDGFEVVALMDANTLIPDIKAIGGSYTLDPRLVSLLDTDVRIVIEWTADDADIDLWVNEPNGERVYYGDKLSSAGGQISNDMTDGYGPEEYAIRRAPRGAYDVRINGFDADRLNPNGAGHVLIRLTRNFGRRSGAETLVDADLSFQQGRNRDDDTQTKPIATLHVASGPR